MTGFLVFFCAPLAFGLAVYALGFWAATRPGPYEQAIERIERRMREE